MPAATWEAQEFDRERARFGVELQFESNTVEAFIDNQVEVIAAYMAQVRYLQQSIEQPCEK